MVVVGEGRSNTDRISTTKEEEKRKQLGETIKANRPECKQRHILARTHLGDFSFSLEFHIGFFRTDDVSIDDGRFIPELNEKCELNAKTKK